tara:strand:+ start:6220 stop:7287 length:1068 start_codon:yes stop_codon:yes gene_type:complete
MDFSHLKIVELATVLAGPSAGMFFAELGAEVIKIENPKTNGDMTRHWKLTSENIANSVSAYYSSINYQKQSIFIDYSTPDGYLELKQLLENSDIVITNFKPQSAEKLQLDFNHVKQINPKIIYAAITGFGDHDKRPAFDVVLQAETGFMSMMGEPERPPVKMPVALIDVLAAHHLKEGILCAMLQQHKTQQAICVTVSLYDAAVASLVNQASNYLMTGHIPSPMGSQHPNIAPYGDCYSTKDDKWLVLAVGTEQQFQKLCSVLGLNHLLQDERFNSNQNRVSNREVLNTSLEQAIKTWNRKELCQVLLASKVPCGEVKNLQEVFEDTKAKNMVLKETIEKVETQRVKSAVFNLTL